MVHVLWRSSRGSNDAAKSITSLVDTHANIDEGNLELLQFLDDELLSRTSVDRQKHKVSVLQFIDVRLVDVLWMRHDMAVHCVVLRLKVLDFPRRFSEFVERRSTWRPEGIVGQQNIAVIQMNRLDRGSSRQGRECRIPCRRVRR